jgi:hypothetical protein
MMSVVAPIIETQQEKENEMENRYTFSGFTFGSNKLFQLLINVKNYSSIGTSTSVELGLELTESERLELIKLLINAEDKDNA